MRLRWWEPAQVVAAVLLVLLSPVLLVSALLVKCTSRGPILFRQLRIGKNGRGFVLYKLRSMVHHAEDHTGPTLSWPGDPRVTFIGRILRYLHIDELPQLVNIMLGDMSFVGPRPERPEIFDTILRDVPDYAERMSVNPGLTGLAQVLGGYDIVPATKLELDIHYIRYCNDRAMDLYVISNTVRKVMGLPVNPRIPHLDRGSS